jgi:hypothetical protein
MTQAEINIYMAGLADQVRNNTDKMIVDGKNKQMAANYHQSHMLEIANLHDQLISKSM